MHRKFADFFARCDSLPDVVTINGHDMELDHSSWPAYRDATEDDMKRAWNEWLGQAADMAKMFLEMRWAVLVSEKPAARWPSVKSFMIDLLSRPGFGAKSVLNPWPSPRPGGSKGMGVGREGITRPQERAARAGLAGPQARRLGRPGWRRASARVPFPARGAEAH